MVTGPVIKIGSVTPTGALVNTQKSTKVLATFVAASAEAHNLNVPAANPKPVTLVITGLGTFAGIGFGKNILTFPLRLVNPGSQGVQFPGSLRMAIVVGH